MKPAYNTTHTYQKTITITVQEIYGTTYPKIPEGWEPTGEFRPPKGNEVGLSSIECSAFTYETDESDRHPRIILRKVNNYSDTDIVDYMLDVIHNYSLGSLCGALYEAVGASPSASKATRKSIIAKMRKEGK